MKRYLLLFAALVPGVANASILHIATRPIAMGGGASSLAFNYSENGRAWIEERDTNGLSDDAGLEYLHYHLPGLRFDPSSRKIVYGRVVCASVTPMAFGFSVENTGQCVLSVVVSSRPHEVNDVVSTIEFETILMDVR
jgi:hypothetical protein